MYFSLFNSHLSYGSVVWGNASSKDIDKIKSLQRRAVRAVHTIPGFFDTEPIFFYLKILNFEDQYKLQLSSLMWDYDHGTLPSLNVLFRRTNTVHNYKMRGAAGGNLYYTKVNSTKYSVCLFKYQGIHILNSLKKTNYLQRHTIQEEIYKRLKILFLLEYRQ